MENTNFESENIKLKMRIVELEALINYYEGQFKLARHRQYGASSEKSEYDFSQLSIFNEVELTADDNILEPKLATIKNNYRKRKRLVNDNLPDNIQVEIVEHSLEPNEQFCSECGENLHSIGTEKRRELVIVPAQVKIREHVRKVYGCRNCEQDEYGQPILRTPVDNPVIKGSFASPEAIAYIMTQKFVMGAPLYRQEQDFKRRGIMLSRQTMSNWLLRATEDWLEPIYDALHELLCLRNVIHADETTLQVLREPGKTAQSKSYMWLYRTSGDSDSHIVLYKYKPNRRKENPQQFLEGFSGYLHTDGYEAYHSLPGDITIIGCWAHVRRKFDEALKIIPEKDRASSETLKGKRYCDKLFALENDFSNLNSDERHKQRQELSRPLMDEFFEWLIKLAALPKTPLGIASGYALKQRKYLENCLLDVRLEISNNRAERSIKPFVIDRKNFLFANTPRGAKASAVMFSLIETAKENGLDPFKYLSYVFKNAPNWDVRNNPDYFEFILPTSLNESIKSSLR